MMIVEISRKLFPYIPYILYALGIVVLGVGIPSFKHKRDTEPIITGLLSLAAGSLFSIFLHFEVI